MLPPFAGGMFRLLSRRDFSLNDSWEFLWVDGFGYYDLDDLTAPQLDGLDRTVRHWLGEWPCEAMPEAHQMGLF